MTTIACDGKSMAGDGYSFTNGTLCARSTVKVHRLKDGSLYGSCGSSGWGDKLQAWFDEGCKGDPPKGKEGDGFLLLKPNGALWQGGEDGLACPIDSPFAIGSGQDYAIGAMDAGLTPGEAVAIASRRDRGTGGKVIVLHLSEPQVRAVA